MGSCIPHGEELESREDVIRMRTGLIKPIQLVKLPLERITPCFLYSVYWLLTDYLKKFALALSSLPLFP
jgi:hypothetical protein